MSDDLTRAIAEALGEAFPNGPWVVYPDTDGCKSVRDATNDEIAAALAPLIEARVREARAEGAAGALLAFMHEAECDADADLAALRSDQWAEEVRRG